MKIGILGAGEYGKAFGVQLRRNGNATYFYDPFLLPNRTLRDVVEFSDVILLAAPSKAVSGIINSLPAEGFFKPLLVATKGVLNKELYDKFENYEIISGPGFASDIVNEKRIKLTVASIGALDGVTLAERLLESEKLRFDKTDDVYGVMLLGALKNIFAIESGRRRLTQRSSMFKEFILEAVKESQQILIYNGGFLETVKFSAGVGDFVLTCGSDMSRNYRFGVRLSEFEGRTGLRKSLDGFFRASKDVRLKKMLAPRGVTVEGVTAAREIERQGIFIPRELEILPDILRRIKNGVK
ncbi:hypothetical protein IKF63_02420 [Candidatus Saccharibacteria bacterium]|nr:hypothetical protein [Candidatus Saccharibacteria bacterium]